MASRIIDVDYYAGGDRKVVTSVDVYKSIRALQLEGVTSQRAAAKILGISRNTVKKYWMGDAVPWDRKAYQREASVITPEVMNYRNLENRIDVTIREGLMSTEAVTSTGWLAQESSTQARVLKQPF